MDIEIRTITEAEYPQYLRILEAAFSYQPRDEDIAIERTVTEIDRSLAALDGGAMVGGAGAYSLVLSVPGERTVPMAGVTAVAVLPTHRRRGVLTALMRRQLDDIREEGAEPIAGLFASEGSIYGRFGYGLATLGASIEIARDRSAFGRRSEPVGRVTLVEREAAMEAMPPVYERMRRGQPGMPERNAVWWDYVFADLEHWRDGASPYFFALHTTGREVDGYAVYRVKHDWEAVPKSELNVRELLADNPQAYAEMWRYCFDVDLIDRIRAYHRPVDEPLVHLLAEPRRLQLRLTDALYIRLVDVPTALEARGYDRAGRIVLDVHDGFCPWNEGRYVLEAGPDGATCRATDEEPDLVLEAADLGAVFLGGVRFTQLAWAGRVTEETPGALSRADEVFGWDPLPWCPEVF